MKDSNVIVVNSHQLEAEAMEYHDEVVIVMPCTDVPKGLRCSRLLQQRAGMPCTILIVHDTYRQGFVAMLNAAARKISARYIVYLAQDAYPGRDWLFCAYRNLEESGNNLLAFNDGKWMGRIASFGMLRSTWVRNIYGGNLFYPGYHSHCADNEITIIAKDQDSFSYSNECLLVECDDDKDFGGSNDDDRRMFEARFCNGFDNQVSIKNVARYRKEYKVTVKSSPPINGISIILHGADKKQFDNFLLHFTHNNSYRPVEIIAIHPSQIDLSLLAPQNEGFAIRTMSYDTMAERIPTVNKAIAQSNLPGTLLCNTGIIFTDDILGLISAQLEAPNIGVTGIRLDTNSESGTCVQHAGIKFAFDPLTIAYKPIQMRLNSLLDAAELPNAIYPAVTPDFLLCRKQDFIDVGGMRQGKSLWLSGVDLCKRIKSTLGKDCLCVNERSLIFTGEDLEQQECGYWDSNLKLLPTHSESLIESTFEKISEMPIGTSEQKPEVRPSGGPKGRFYIADIIVCIHNAYDDVKRCIESISEYTDLNIHNLILVDDGSDDETKQLVIQSAIEHQATYVRNEQASGYTKAANKGLSASRGDFAILLNSDTIVTPNWIDRLMTCASSDPDTACVGPLSNAASWQSIPQLTDKDGNWVVNDIPEGMTLNTYANNIASNSPRLYPQTGFINGFCYLITRKAIDTLGLLDEETFPRGYGEEDDFSLRAQKAGLKLFIADDTYVFHAKSKSFTPAGRLELVNKSKGKLQDKHGQELIRSKVNSIKTDEQLLIARTWAKLAGSISTNKPVSPFSTGKTVKIGWLQPHLLCTGGIRRAIEMTNRLTAWGADVALITPSGDSPTWLPALAKVITTEEAKSHSFDLLIVSDPDTVSYLQTIKAKRILNYHLAAYMLYRTQNSDLDMYYSNESNIFHVANSKWTAEQIEQNYPIRVTGIFPGGINRKQFRPIPGLKRFDVVSSGSHRIHKGQQDIDLATKGLTVGRLADFHLEQSQLAEVISAGRVFASGCFHEGFNFCPLESMACGTPVVLTDCGGSREYARHEENALVTPTRNPEYMRKAIDRLLNDTELRLLLIENGIETAWAFNWDDMTMKFSHYIKEIL